MIRRGTRWLLVVFTVLTLLAFVVLFGLSARTGALFAWTIEPPITAAWLGAAYAGGCTLVALNLRARCWMQLRAPLLAVFVFTVVTLVATLLHLDRFHLRAGGVAGAAAWAWLAVYVVVPVWMVVVFVRQGRTAPPAGHDAMPLPVLLRLALLLQGLVLLGVGAALFVVPRIAAAGWPWPLTPLTARAVAAWLLAFGLASLLVLREHDLARLPIALWAYLVVGVLDVVVLVRYAKSIDWGTVGCWLYLGVLASILAASIGALVRLRLASGGGARQGAAGNPRPT